MISFKNFFNNLLFEGSVKSYKNFIHLVDLPMFSIFFDKSILENQELMQFTVIKRMKTPEGVEQFLEHFGDHLKSILREAQSSLGKIGFTRMHSNIVFVDTSKSVNQNTGVTGDVAGYARRDKHYMAIDMSYFINNYRTNPDVISNTIVHEWAHLWFFQNSKAFKKSVQELYKDTVFNPQSLRGYTNYNIPKEATAQLQEYWNSTIASLFEYICLKSLYNIKINDKSIGILKFAILDDIKGVLKNNFQYHDKDEPVYCVFDIDKKEGFFIKSSKSNETIDYVPLDLKLLNRLIKTEYPTFEEAIEASIKQGINELPDFFKSDFTDISLSTIISDINGKIENFFETKKMPKIDEEDKRSYINDISEFIAYRIHDFLKNNSKQNNLEYYFFNNTDTEEERRKFIQTIVIGDEISRFKNEPYDFSYIEAVVSPYLRKIYLDLTINDLKNRGDLSDPKNDDLRRFISNTINWIGKGGTRHSAYGMSNVDEFWATAIDGFFGLTNKHKALFVDLVKNKISNDTETKIKKRKEPIKARQRRSQKLEDIKNIFNGFKSYSERFSKEKILRDNEIDENIITELINLTLSTTKITKITQEVKQLLYKLVLDMFKDYNYEPEPIEYVIIKRIINTRTR